MENDHQIQSVRAFNRYYTKMVGALGDHSMNGPFNLSEMRILHELGKRDGITATELADELAMDHGFLSRKIAALIAKRQIKRTRSKIDKREYSLALTALGRKQQPRREAEASAHVASMLQPILPEKRVQLVTAMETIQRILRTTTPPPVIFRQLGHGDAGWIVYRHGAVMAKEFGWNHEFEALAAQIMADFIRNYQPAWERSWIVERGGEILGSLLLIRENETTARLRLLYVEPVARGLGLATKLLEKSIQFARAKGYQKLTLFTTSSNHAARRIYIRLGMHLAREEPSSFAGTNINGEHWELTL